MCRLSLYSNCNKELVAKQSTQYADSLPANTILSKCVQCQFGKLTVKPYHPVKTLVLIRSLTTSAGVQKIRDGMSQRQLPVLCILRILHRGQQN